MPGLHNADPSVDCVVPVSSRVGVLPLLVTRRKGTLFIDLPSHDAKAALIHQRGRAETVRIMQFGEMLALRDDAPKMGLG